MRCLIEGERNIQGFFTAYLSLSTYYLTAPEVELNHGYCDFFLMPDLRRYPMVAHSYIIELKYLKQDATARRPRRSGRKPHPGAHAMPRTRRCACSAAPRSYTSSWHSIIVIPLLTVFKTIVGSYLLAHSLYFGINLICVLKSLMNDETECFGT